jgi:hypothetical protein
MEQARGLLLPLPGKGPDYPVGALGALADACTTVSEEGQVSVEMAGHCLLATAALLVQSIANVRTLAGIKPLSLYALTIAESGEGKSTAEETALRAITEWQKEKSRIYRQSLEEIQRARRSRRRDECMWEMPREPYRIMKDGTVEGIRRSFKEGHPTQGVFSSEAAVMLAGYGMSPDNRAMSAGNFNDMWDNGELSVARGLDGRLQLYDRRLSIHWLVQPDVAYSALHDPLLSNVGFWPRFLLSWPPPSPPLSARRFEPESFSSIREYWGRCDQLLEEPLGEDCSGLPVISPTAEAENLACQFFDRMQIEAKTADGTLTGVKPFAVRATEQAFRVAGVLAAFSGHEEIDVEAMRNGIALASFSLESWRSTFGDKDENEARSLALALYEWMLRQKGQRATASAMLRIGPKMLRSKSRRDTALSLLHQEQLILRERDTWFAPCQLDQESL